MKPYRLDPEAELELEDAIAVYEQQREGRGIRFRIAVEVAIRDIQERPAAFPRFPRTQARECILRRFPYAIYFIELDESIRILAVAHGKRRRGYWRKRFRGQ